MTADDNDRIIEHLLVLRAQLGDDDALVRLFERYNERLLYYVRRLVDSSQDAEDVLQSVWLTVCRRVGTLDHPAAFRTWLYRIARNRAITQLRRRGREVSLEETTDDPAVAASDDADTFDEVDVADLHRALARLSVAHRDALTLRFLEALSYEEIARIMDCDVGTVRSRLFYGKKALRKQIERSPADKSASPPRLTGE